MKYVPEEFYSFVMGMTPIQLEYECNFWHPRKVGVKMGPLPLEAFQVLCDDAFSRNPAFADFREYAKCYSHYWIGTQTVIQLL